MEEGERRGKEKKMENGGRPQDEFRHSASLFLFFPFSQIQLGMKGLRVCRRVGWLITRLVGGGEGKGFIVT